VAKMGSKAFESPLISHARMRALYRALVEARVLGERKGRGAATGWRRGFEACWVGTAVDLKDGDLVSVESAAWLVDYVRAVGAKDGSVTAAEMGRALRARTVKVSGSSAAMDRMLCAVGMAMALKAAGGGVVLAYAASDELTVAEWKRLLTLANEDKLPLAIVVTPGRTPTGVDVSAVVKRLGATSIPVIPVDAGDAVAIYRVTQETLVRARVGDGVAVIECADCGLDPVRTMGNQLVKKKICTEHWVSEVEVRFRARVARG